MDFIVKLLFLSGKYISQVAGRTILEIIHRSKELHKHISVKYEKASEIVKPYNSMLDLLNERIKEASENDVHFACMNEEFKKQLGEHISQLPARKKLEDNITSTEAIRQQRVDQQTLLEKETTERNFDDFEYDKIYADLCRDLLKQSSAILNGASVKKFSSDSTDQIIASTTMLDNSLKITEIIDDKTVYQTSDANAEFTNSDLEFGLVPDALDDFSKEISSSKPESFDFESSLINEKEEDYLDLKDIKKYQVSNITLDPFSNLYFGDACNMIHRTEQSRTKSHRTNTAGEKRSKELRSASGSKEQNRFSNTTISRKIFKVSFNELLNIEDVIQVNNRQTLRGLRQEIENRTTLQSKNREHFHLFERKLYEKIMKNKTKQIAKDRESRSLILAHNTSHYNNFESKLGQRLKKGGISKIGSRRRLCSKSGVESDYGDSFTQDVNEFVRLLKVNEREFRKLERKVTQMLLHRGFENINFIKINYKEINKPICKYCLSHKDKGEMKEREKILNVNRKVFEEFERDIERIVILDKNKPVEKKDELIDKQPSTYDNRVKIPSQSTLKFKPYKASIKKKKSLVKQNIKPNFTFDKSLKINIKGLQKLQKLSAKEPFSLKTKLSNNDREDMRERASIIEVNAKAFEIFEDSVSSLIPIKNNCNLTISRTMTSQSKDNFHVKRTTSSSQNRFNSMTSNINTTPTVSETLKELLDKPMVSNSNKSNVQINKNSIILDKTTASRNDFDRIIKTLKKEHLKNQIKLSVNPSVTNNSTVKNKNSGGEKRNTLKYLNDKSRISNSQYETMKKEYSIAGKDETIKESLNSKDQFVDNLRDGDKGKTPKSSNITFPSANAVTEYKEKPIKTSVMSTENQFDRSKSRNAIIKAEVKSENSLVEKPTNKKDICEMKDVYSPKAIMNRSTHNLQNQKKSIIKLNNVGRGSPFRIGDFVSRKCSEEPENIQRQISLMAKKETEKRLNVKQSFLPLKSSNGSNIARFNMNKNKSLNYLKIHNKMPENANSASDKEQIDKPVTKPNFQEEMAGDKFFQNLQTNTQVMSQSDCGEMIPKPSFKNIKKEYRTDTNELEDSLKNVGKAVELNLNDKASLSNKSNEQYRLSTKYQLNTSDLNNQSSLENKNKITSELDLRENSSTKSDNNCVGITQSRTDTYLTVLNNSKDKYRSLPNDLEQEFQLHKSKFFKNAENLTKEPNEGERLNDINQKNAKPSRIPNIITKAVQKLKDNDIANVDKSGKTAVTTSEKNVLGKKLFQGMYVKNLSSDSNSKDETTTIYDHNEKREHNYEKNKEANPNMSSNFKLSDQPSVANTLYTNECDSSTSDPDCSHHGLLIKNSEQNKCENSKNQNTCDVTDSKEYMEMLNEINKLVAKNEKKKSLLQLLTNTAESHDNESGSSSINAKSIHRNYGFSSFNNNEIINNNRDGSTSEIDISKLSQVKEGIGTKSHLKQAESVRPTSYEKNTPNEFLKVKKDDQMTRTERKSIPANAPVMPKSSQVLEKYNNDSEAVVMPYTQLKTIQIPKKYNQIIQNQKKGVPVSETIIPTPSQFNEKNNNNFNISAPALQPKENNEVMRYEKKKRSLSKTVTLESDRLNHKLYDYSIETKLKTVQNCTEIDEKDRSNNIERAREDIQNDKMKIIDNKLRNTADQNIKNSNSFESPQISCQYKEIKHRSNIPCAKNIMKINDNLSDKIVNNNSSSTRIFSKVGSKSDKGNISDSKLADNSDNLSRMTNPVANTSKYSEKNNEYLLEKGYNKSTINIAIKNKESEKNVNFFKINGTKLNANDIITYKDEYCLKKVVAPIPIKFKEPEKLCRDRQQSGALKEHLKSMEVNNQLKSEDVNEKKNTNMESVIPNKEQSKKILRYQFNNTNNTYKNDLYSTIRKQNPFRRSHIDEVEQYRNLLSREFINNMEREDDANKELKNIEKNRLTSNLKHSEQNNLDFERNSRTYAKPFELSRMNMSDKQRLQTMNFKIPRKNKEVIVSNNFSDAKLQEQSVKEIEEYIVGMKKEENINLNNEFLKVPEAKTTSVPKYIERSQTDFGKSIRKFAFVPPKADVSYKDGKLYSHQYDQSYKQNLQNTDLNTAQKYTGATVQNTFSDTKSQKQSSNLNDENRNEKTEDHKSFDMKIEAKNIEQSQASSKQNIRNSSLIPSRVETPQKQERFHKYLNTLQKAYEERLQIMDLDSSQKNTGTIVQNNFSNMKLQDQSKKPSDENKIKIGAHINSNNELLRSQERVTAIPKYTERTKASAKQNVENFTFIPSKMHDASYEPEMTNTHLSALQESTITNDEQTLNLVKLNKNIDQTEKYRTLTCRKYVNNFYTNSDKSTNVAEREENFKDIDQNQNKFENNSRETEYCKSCVPTRMKALLKQEMQSTSVNPLQKKSLINSDQENNSSTTNLRKINQKSIYLNNNVHQIDDGMWGGVHSNKGHFNVAKKPLIPSSKGIEQFQINSERNTENPKYMKSLLPSRMNAPPRQDIQTVNTNLQELDQRPMCQNKKMNEAEAHLIYPERINMKKEPNINFNNESVNTEKSDTESPEYVKSFIPLRMDLSHKQEIHVRGQNKIQKSALFNNDQIDFSGNKLKKVGENRILKNEKMVDQKKRFDNNMLGETNTDQCIDASVLSSEEQQSKTELNESAQNKSTECISSLSNAFRKAKFSFLPLETSIYAENEEEAQNSKLAEGEKEIELKNFDTLYSTIDKQSKRFPKHISPLLCYFLSKKTSKLNNREEIADFEDLDTSLEQRPASATQKLFGKKIKIPPDTPKKEETSNIYTRFPFLLKYKKNKNSAYEPEVKQKTSNAFEWKMKFLNHIKAKEGLVVNEDLHDRFPFLRNISKQRAEESKKRETSDKIKQSDKELPVYGNFDLSKTTKQ